MQKTISEYSIHAYKTCVLPNIKQKSVRVYNAIKKHGPVSCSEVAELFGVHPHTISGRFSELKREGHIIRTGHIKIGKTLHQQYTITGKKE